MRFVLAMVLAGLVASPLSVSAQAGEEATASEENLQEPAPPSEPAPEEPALQLKLDAAGVDVVPSPPRTVDGYTLEEIELRIRRARIGLCALGDGAQARSWRAGARTSGARSGGSCSCGRSGGA